MGVQADDTIGGYDQHVSNLRDLARDTAGFQVRQIMPVCPDTARLLDIAEREVLDGVAERYVVDFDHAEHVLRRKIGQGAGLVLRLNDDILTRLPLGKAKKARNQKY